MTETKTMVLDNDHLAAAVAAAAELAKNGGAYLYSTDERIKQEDSFPMTIPPSPERETFSNASDEDDDEEADDSIKDREEEDAGRRIDRSRERNREHARRTRLRKKAQLEALQSKINGLEAESKVLKQSLEECSIASILVGLSSASHDATIQSLLKNASATEGKCGLKIVGGKRKRLVSVGESSERVVQPLKINIDGEKTVIGVGRTHINWKTGLCNDDNGTQRQLTQEQLESLRRERNRMHAKMTRDRKKSFISTIATTIEELESNNQRMKEALFEVIQTHFKSSTTIFGVSPMSSPETKAVISPQDDVPPLKIEKAIIRPTKKTRHGFRLM